MAGSTRIKGAALMLKLGATPTDYWADITSCSIESEEADSDVVTFEDASLGGAWAYKMKITAIQSTATASFWRYVWANTGQTVAYVYAPHGNAVASTDKPHFTGNVKIGKKPNIGGEAGATSTYTFEVEWDCEAEPVLKTTA